MEGMPWWQRVALIRALHSRAAVPLGSPVQAGQVIGRVGPEDFMSQGAHLHQELLTKAGKINPRSIPQAALMPGALSGPRSRGQEYNAPRPGRLHKGLDTGARPGTPLTAPVPGTVVRDPRLGPKYAFAFEPSKTFHLRPQLRDDATLTAYSPGKGFKDVGDNTYTQTVKPYPKTGELKPGEKYRDDDGTVWTANKHGEAEITPTADSVPERSPWSQGLRNAVPLPGESDVTVPTTRIARHPAQDPRQPMTPTPMVPGVAPEAVPGAPPVAQPDFMYRLGDYWKNKLEPRLQGKDGTPPVSAILMALGAGMLQRKPGAGLNQLFAQWPQMQLANQLRQMQIGQITSSAEQKKQMQQALLSDPDPQVSGLAKAGLWTQAAQFKAYKMRVPFELSKANALNASKPQSAMAKATQDYEQARARFGDDHPTTVRLKRAMENVGLGESQKTALQAIAMGRNAIRAIDTSIAKSGKLTPSGPGDLRGREQQFAIIQKTIAQAMNMGANWTESEQRIGQAIAGGDPTSIWTWLTDNPKEYRKRLRALDTMMAKARTFIMRGGVEAKPMDPVDAPKVKGRAVLPPGVKYRGAR